ncbi:MAG TPA: MFS transporter, partial [Luteitalea sp.]|nr:MFS transporter [Luteitalea sp.]
MRFLVLLCALAFISLGLPDGLIGVAWPSMRVTFGRALDDLGVLLIAATTGYISTSFASGWLLRQFTLGGVLTLSCVCTAVALGGYAMAWQWWLLLPLAVVLGAGGGGIDAALNSYVAARHGARTLNLLHACYGIGAALGPLLMTAVLQAGRPWQRGYALTAAAQVVLAMAFAATLRFWPVVPPEHAHARGATLRATSRLPAARLGVLVFIAYTGLEASVGAWTYTVLTLGRGVAPTVAGLIVTAYWSGLTGGRLIAALVGGRYAPPVILRVALTGMAIGVIGIWLSTMPALVASSIALVGLSAGPVFPTLTALTPARVGPAHLENAVGFQIAAGAIGISVVPALVGLGADAFGVAVIPPVLVAL